MRRDFWALTKSMSMWRGLYRVFDGALGNFVENIAGNFFRIEPERFAKVPADGFSFAVLVRRYPYLFGVFYEFFSSETVFSFPRSPRSSAEATGDVDAEVFFSRSRICPIEALTMKSFPRYFQWSCPLRETRR